MLASRPHTHPTRSPVDNFSTIYWKCRGTTHILRHSPLYCTYRNLRLGCGWFSPKTSEICSFVVFLRRPAGRPTSHPSAVSGFLLPFPLAFRIWSESVVSAYWAHQLFFQKMFGFLQLCPSLSTAIPMVFDRDILCGVCVEVARLGTSKLS